MEPFYFCYVKHDYLLERIESLRQQLIQAANEKKSLTDEAVLRLSQELDMYLFEFQRRSESKIRIDTSRKSSENFIESMFFPSI
ncbi:aspartyl-phosphate phosphatase Spo0E family protein [Paenibacillus apiarius]|nr:aspartyl-phosphate phosphatase Spo0E family protein [Paenibacillus apiarius]